jgi:hypothetical protein
MPAQFRSPKRIAPVRGERKLALVIGNAAYPKAPKQETQMPW